MLPSTSFLTVFVETMKKYLTVDCQYIKQSLEQG
jgi:hypothetical protein